MADVGGETTKNERNGSASTSTDAIVGNKRVVGSIAKVLS